MSKKYIADRTSGFCRAYVNKEPITFLVEGQQFSRRIAEGIAVGKKTILHKGADIAKKVSKSRRTSRFLSVLDHVTMRSPLWVPAEEIFNPHDFRGPYVVAPKNASSYLNSKYQAYSPKIVKTVHEIKPGAEETVYFALISSRLVAFENPDELKKKHYISLGKINDSQNNYSHLFSVARQSLEANMNHEEAKIKARNHSLLSKISVRCYGNTFPAFDAELQKAA
jgi:hypothetical protein